MAKWRQVEAGHSRMRLTVSRTKPCQSVCGQSAGYFNNSVSRHRHSRTTLATSVGRNQWRPSSFVALSDGGRLLSLENKGDFHDDLVRRDPISFYLNFLFLDPSTPHV